MNRVLCLCCGAVLFTVLNALPAFALPQLIDWAFNVDGTIYENYAGDSIPLDGELNENGLGILTLVISEQGAHNLHAFFDYEISDSQNTCFNEYGAAVNIPDSLQTWEIDEPGYVFGDIYDNVMSATLDNSNSIPEGCPDDVAWAMGWDFSLNAGEIATITFLLGMEMPSDGFFLEQTDEETGESVYFSSRLSIVNASPVPEPSTFIMLAGGIGLLVSGRKKKLFARLHS